MELLSCCLLASFVVETTLKKHYRQLYPAYIQLISNHMYEILDLVCRNISTRLEAKTMQDLIHKIGLSPKEEVVLLALLELGAETVTRIAQKANLNRTTCYDILERLNILGLVGYVGDRSKKTFVAEPPETLVSYLERRSKQFADRANEVKKALPQLKAIYNQKGRGPKIRYYEGPEGLQTAYEDTLTTHEPIRAYASVRNMHDTLPQYFPEYYKRRTKTNCVNTLF